MPYSLDIRGWMDEVELKVLETWAKSLPSQAIAIEIGSFYGRSSYCLAKSMKPDSILYCFDQWGGEIESERDIPSTIRIAKGFPLVGTSNTLENFLNNMRGIPNLVAQKVHTPESIEWKDAQVDLVFVDAAHENPIDWSYIEYWLPKIKCGGWICGHDYTTKRGLHRTIIPDVVENVQRLEKILQKPVETFAATSLWRFQKTTD